jgi:hypothetical protein
MAIISLSREKQTEKTKRKVTESKKKRMEKKTVNR